MPVVGAIQESNQSTVTEQAVGTLDVEVKGIVLQPSDVTFTPQRNGMETVAAALVVVAALTTIPLIPQIQTGLMTSSIRGISVLNWVFFGNVSRRRRKWGVIRDAVTGIPVAGVLVRLVNQSTNEIIKEMRTDRTGRFGFVIGRNDESSYQLVIDDPLYEHFEVKENGDGQ